MLRLILCPACHPPPPAITCQPMSCAHFVYWQWRAGATRLPTPETAFSLCAGISGNGGQGATHGMEIAAQHPPASATHGMEVAIQYSISGNGGQVSGNLPAITTHAGIEPAPCTWRWQAGGGEVYLIREGGCPLLGQIRSQI